MGDQRIQHERWRVIPHERRDPEGGFTLIETFVAMGILLLSIVGPLTLVSQSIGTGVYAREQTVATYLAAEGIEFIRSIRDDNRLAGRSWRTGFSQCVTALGGSPVIRCFLDVPKGNLRACDGSCPLLYFNSGNGLFGENLGGSSWRPSPFTRVVEIRELSADEVAVAVTISWKLEFFGARSYTAKENLFNWGL